MSVSKVFLYFCLSFVAGIFLSSIIKISLPPIMGLLILGIISISILWNCKKAVVFGFCLLFLVLGLWRCQSVESKIKNNELRIYNDKKESIVLIGKVFSEPDIRSNNVKLSIETEKIIVNNQEVPISGKVLVTANKYPGYNYGDELKIKGKLETPPSFEDFNYKDYLEKQGIVSVIYWPEIQLLKPKAFHGLASQCFAAVFSAKNKLRNVIYQNMSPPESSLLTALLLGDQSQMPKDLKDKLNISGLRHITAVSGMNITILCSILMSLLLGLGFWRGHAFYISLALIFLFVLMVGFQASAVRAAIMGGIFLLGQKVGRRTVGSRAVMVAAVVMLAINPLLLLGDIGFQLSFLAIIGLISLVPLLENWLKFIPQEKFINLRSIIATTLSAQVFTLPILIYNFGRISLVSPITNILVLPVIYLIMVLGLAFVLIGLFWNFLSWILFFPCWIILAYIIKVTEIFSRPWAAVTVEKIHWFWLVLFYFILGILVWQHKKKTRLRFLDY